MNIQFITMNVGTIKRAYFLINGDHIEHGNIIEQNNTKGSYRIKIFRLLTSWSWVRILPV
jgi:hypothetical protein